MNWKEEYDRLGKEIDEIVEAAKKDHPPAKTSKEYEEYKKQNPVKRPDAYVDENPSNKKRPCAPQFHPKVEEKLELWEIQKIPDVTATESILIAGFNEDAFIRTYDERYESTTKQYRENHGCGTKNRIRMLGGGYRYTWRMAENKVDGIAYDENADCNYEMDLDGNIKLIIEHRFKAAKRGFPTACSKNKSTRFKCPTCNKEEIGIVKIKEIAKQMKIPGYRKMSEKQLFSIPEIKQEVIRRLNAKEFNFIITAQNPISANEYGHCPICGKQVRSNARHTKGSHRKAQPITPFKREFTLIYPFDIDEHVDLSANFNVNKKSDGRGPTGWLDVDAMKPSKKQHRHTPSIIIKPRISYKSAKRSVKDKGIEKFVEKVSYNKPCECGCMTILHDTRRNENVCPKCGLVLSR